MWKRKYGSLGATELRELRQLREENGKLKRLVADLTLDKHILSEIVRKKSEAGATPRARVMDAGVLRSEPESCVPAGGDFAIAVRLLQPSTRPGGAAPPDARVGSVAALVRISAHSRFAASRGLGDQHEARPTSYRLEGLQLGHRVRRRKHASLHRGVPPAASRAHERWSMEFVHDATMDGRAFRELTVVDQWSRWSPILEVWLV